MEEPPIVNQPLKKLENPIMTISRELPSYPPGLEPLNNTNLLILQDQHEISNSKVQNKYAIKNQTGEKIYYAEDGPANRGERWPMQMNIFDNNRNIVIHLYRRLACDNCCCPCCLPNMEISAPPGQVIGRVQKQWSICQPIFNITNHENEIIFRVKGPLCMYCYDFEFQILSADGQEQIGKITKQWTMPCLSRVHTDAIFFGVRENIDVRMKAVLLGACIIIDYMFYQM